MAELKRTWWSGAWIAGLALLLGPLVVWIEWGDVMGLILDAIYVFLGGVLIYSFLWLVVDAALRGWWRRSDG